MIARIGRWSYHNRFAMLGIWVVSLVVVIGAAGTVGAAWEASAQSPDSESTDGFDVIEEYFPGTVSELSGTIVFRAENGVEDPAVVEAMTEMFDEAEQIDGVTIVSPYTDEGANQIADSGSNAGLVAYATVNLEEDMDFTEASEIGVELFDIAPQTEELQVEIGGAVLAEFEAPESEFIGLAFAIVVLILAFGSVLAMGLPIGVALFGVGIGLAFITLLSHVFSVPDFSLTLGAMIGIGVGIDYALFIVTRYREGLHKGRSQADALYVAMDTAGRAVIFAGSTVVISLLGMLLIGLPFISGLGIAAATTVAVTMIASVTLLPALLSLAGPRVERTRVRGLVAAAFIALALLGVGLGISPLLIGAPLAVVTLLAGLGLAPLKREIPRRPPKPMRETFFYRWSRIVQAYPWLAALGGAGVLIVLMLPVFGMRLGFSDESNYSIDTTTRQAYELLVDGFGPGFNGPLVITGELSDPADTAAVDALVEAFENTDGVVEVQGPIPNDPDNTEAVLIQVFPETGPQDEATTDLVGTIRDDVVPAATIDSGLDVKVTGTVAASVDFTDYLSDRLFLFFGVVLALSFLLLMTVFRSLLVPLKAVIMNLLSIGAAFGIVIAVFQWGWAADVVGIAGGAPIEPFMPMMLFAIVFGLSMDYEVFLLTRIKEEYDRTGDAVNSVADGLAMTARVITAAAAIMVVVFGSFVFEDDRVVKLFGLGLAMAVFLDATLVRMLLVPATMELLGARNWWLPKWLDRILPNISIEGSPEDREPPEPPEPEPERELVGV